MELKAQLGKVLDYFLSTWIQNMKGLSVIPWGRDASNKNDMVCILIVQSPLVAVDVKLIYSHQTAV